MPIIIPSNRLATSAGYSVDQSMRFDAVNKSFITEDSGGGFVKETTSTISMWVKRGGLYTGSGTNNTFYGAFYGNSGRYDWMQFDSSDRWAFGTRNTDATTSAAVAADNHRVTNMVFRDPAAWYHLVIAFDSTNAVASERIRMFVNGERITSFATELAIPQNRGFYTMSTGVENNIGAYEDNTGYNQNLYFDGYMAEVALIDGTAYDASDFGEYNSSNIWVPKDISELTFGSNGIYYKGQDSSALGNDSSGNGNNGTLRNMAAHDQMLDTPTNNFAVINSIYADATTLNSVTLSEGNLDIDGTSSAFDMKGMTFNLPKSGKWYFEYTIGGAYDGFGFCVVGEEGSISASNGLGNLSASQGGGIQYRGWRNGGNYTVTFSTYSSSSFTSGDIHQVAIDVDNGKWYYGISNTYYANDGGTDGNPSSGTNHLATFDFAGNDVVLMTAVTTDSNEEHWNFGQNGTFNGTKTAQGNSDANGVGNFYYSVPSGYKALCSKNVGS